MHLRVAFSWQCVSFQTWVHRNVIQRVLAAPALNCQFGRFSFDGRCCYDYTRNLHQPCHLFRLGKIKSNLMDSSRHIKSFIKIRIKMLFDLMIRTPDLKLSKPAGIGIRRQHDLYIMNVFLSFGAGTCDLISNFFGRIFKLEITKPLQWVKNILIYLNNLLETYYTQFSYCVERLKDLPKIQYSRLPWFFKFKSTIFLDWAAWS